MIHITRKADVVTKNYKYYFQENIKQSLKTNEFIPLRFDMEGSMIDFWDGSQNTWIWDEEATSSFKNWFGQNLSSEQGLTKNEKEILLNILDSERIDSINGDNKLDQDELGLIMAKLGREDMKDIYL